MAKSAKKKSAEKQEASEACCAPLSAADKKQRAEWQAEDDARALQRAMEIKADPKRMAQVRAWAKKRSDEIAKLASLHV